MNKYFLCSDKYKSLHNIFYNGEYYTIKELLQINLDSKIIVELIRNNLEIK